MWYRACVPGIVSKKATVSLGNISQMIIILGNQCCSASEMNMNKKCAPYCARVAPHKLSITANHEITEKKCHISDLKNIPAL